VPFIGLINFFNNFDYFSQKTRKMPIPAMVKIRITSFLYKIWTQILRV